MTIFLITLLAGLSAFAFNTALSCLLVYTRRFNTLRIQEKTYRPEDINQRLPLICKNFFSTIIAAGIAFALLQDFFIIHKTPSWLTLCGNVALIMLFHDTWIYFLHRYMHRNPWLFRHVHCVHHHAHHPIPLDYLYLHWFEALLGAVGMIVAIILLSPINIYSLWAYLFVLHLHEGHIHWGLRSALPFQLPFFTSTAHHDLHHAQPRRSGNFAPMLSIWDVLLKTETRPAQRYGKPTISTINTPVAEHNGQQVTT